MLKLKETSTCKFVRVRERNQITLPSEILAGLPVEVGDFLEIQRTETGLELRPTRLVTLGTPAAEREDREAEREIGRFKNFKSTEALKDNVRKRFKKKQPVAMASD